MCQVNILLLGALSWNPERVLCLADNGHRLYGLWSRSMGWEQGPYAFADGVITDLDTEGAIDLLNDRTIDIVYSLFQLYDRELWAAEAGAGVEDVWVQLRRLLAARQSGAFDAPIVRHWGFDVHDLDLDVVRALDGQIFCNRHKLDYWTTPRKAGGCGLDLGLDEQETAIFDSDLPSLEFMNDRFAPKLSAGDGEIHTVCVGRPLGIDFLRAAREGIHVHVYGNDFDDVAALIARELSPRGLFHLPGLIANYLHVHKSLQPDGWSLEAIRSAKNRWVEEFSRYDAGWSYIGRPLPWPRLEDAGAIPNKLGTYLLAGLPIIVERLPGFHRYDTVKAQGVAIDFNPRDYRELAAALRRRDELARKTVTARRIRKEFSFEATIESLVPFLEGAIERGAGRRGPVAVFQGEASRPVRLAMAPLLAGRRSAEYVGPTELGNRLELLLEWAGRRPNSLLSRFGTNEFVSWTLRQPGAEPPVAATNGRAADSLRAARVAVIERFPATSRNCDPDNADAGGGGVHVLRLAGDQSLLRADGLRVPMRERARCAALPWRCLRSVAGIVGDQELSPRDKRSLVGSALATRGAPLAALAAAHDAVRLLRSNRFDRIDCYSARGFPLVAMLSELFGIPYAEFLATGTRYFGEFAFELFAVVPYAYWLHRQGHLKLTQSRADTSCLYYFSPRHEELSGPRTFVPVSEYPCLPGRGTHFDYEGFPERLNTAQWSPPPYKTAFQNEMFRWPKPLCIVTNKFTPEPSTASGKAVNFIPVPVLVELLDLLVDRYQVIYVRPRPNDIVGDHQEIGDIGDFAAIKERFPDVLTIQQLHGQHPEFSFNELQMKLFANCERFISVLGGSSYLASYFGGTNIIYAREGWELPSNAYKNWFPLFSGTEIHHAGEPREFLELVRRHILS